MGAKFECMQVAEGTKQSSIEGMQKYKISPKCKIFLKCNSSPAVNHGNGTLIFLWLSAVKRDLILGCTLREDGSFVICSI